MFAVTSLRARTTGVILAKVDAAAVRSGKENLRAHSLTVLACVKAAMIIICVVYEGRVSGYRCNHILVLVELFAILVVFLSSSGGT